MCIFGSWSSHQIVMLIKYRLGYVLLASWQQIQPIWITKSVRSKPSPRPHWYHLVHIHAHIYTCMYIWAYTHIYTFFLEWWLSHLYLLCSLVNPKIIGLTGECQFRIWSVSEMAGWNYQFPSVNIDPSSFIIQTSYQNWIQYSVWIDTGRCMSCCCIITPVLIRILILLWLNHTQHDLTFLISWWPQGTNSALWLLMLWCPCTVPSAPPMLTI